MSKNLITNKILSYSIMAALDRDGLENRLNEIQGRLDVIHDEITAIQNGARWRQLNEDEFERVVALRGERRVLDREAIRIRAQLVQIRGPTADDVRRDQVRERMEQIAVQAAEMRQPGRPWTRSRSRSRSGPWPLSRSRSRTRSRSRSTGSRTRRSR